MVMTMTNQNQTPLLDAVTTFIETQPTYFRIPGHRLDKGISPRWTQMTGERLFAYDVTETPLTDDLHNPQGAIYKAQQLLQELYGADQSFFLVNGSTCGNEAMILSAAFEGEQIMMARNAHKSAMMGLILSGAEPVYVMPQMIDAWGIQGGITPKTVRDSFETHPNCKALFLVNPSYYGICSDLRQIADICHEYGALLLVDEAHGGHFYFHEQLPLGALQAGADLCVQSMHKVTGALTQSSVLHVKNHGIRSEVFLRIAQNLHLVQSTSPSYLLMTSLDCARYELAMHGTKMMDKALLLACNTRDKINKIPGFVCMTNENVYQYKDNLSEQMKLNQAGIYGMDQTRLVISAQLLGLSGYELDQLLFEKYAVNVELSDYKTVLAIVTYANEKKDMDKLVDACEQISEMLFKQQRKKEEKPIVELSSWEVPRQVMTPRKAYFCQTREVCWKDAIGEIAAQMISPYPPGIPIVCPGEEISPKVWAYLEQLIKDGRQIHGMESGNIKVVR